MCGNRSRLSPRAPRGQSNRGTEPVAFRKQSQDLGARGAEGAVPGAVFRKWRRRKSCWLVGQPVLARDQPGPVIGPGPGEHLLSLEEVAQRGDGADRPKRSLAVPAADACVEDRVRESEEELDVGVNTDLAGPVVVSARNKLTKEIPMPRRQL